MNSNTAQTADLDATEAEQRETEWWMALATEARVAQGCDDDAPDQNTIDAIEEQLDRYQSDTPWQADLASQDMDGAGAHDIAARKLDAIVAELQRIQMRVDWLSHRMDDVQYAEGAQDCDRAVRRMTAIDAVIDGVRARQAQLTADAIKARAAEDCYGPDANDIDALDAACLA